VGDWNTLDLGIGAVGGAIIAGAVAIFLDQRRRRDEKKSRFIPEKLRVYQVIINLLDTMVADAIRRAEIAPVYSRIDQGTHDETDLAAVREWSDRLDAHYEEVRVGLKDARDLMFFGGRKSLEPLGRMLKAIDNLQQCAGDGQTDDVARHRDEYKRASADYLAATRRELGIRG
jgi:hypothetical protein